MIAALGACASIPSKPAEKPSLAVMSALPLFWQKEDIGAGLTEDQRAPVIKHLAGSYRITPLDMLAPEGLRPFTLLVLAQPRALAPAELVALDGWVRVGGRVVIFADPQLDWPGPYPAGDRRRPPGMSLLDPLLDHWGLRLDQGDGGAGEPQIRVLAGHRIVVQSAGRWHRVGGGCVVTDARLRADCVIGMGRALLIADADLLDLTQGESQNQDSGAVIAALLEAVVSEIRPTGQ